MFQFPDIKNIVSRLHAHRMVLIRVIGFLQLNASAVHDKLGFDITIAYIANLANVY